MRRILTTGVTALALAWSMACGDVNINGPDWPDWTPPKDTTGQVRVPSTWRGSIAAGKQIEIKGVSSLRAIPRLTHDAKDSGLRFVNQ